MVKNLLHIDTKKKHISIEQYNNELDKAMKQIDQDKFVTHETASKASEKWFKRK